MSAATFRSQLTGMTGPNSGHFPDPFMDMATASMPQSMRNTLHWCEYIFMSHGTYRQAMERIISYFLTEIELEDVSDDEKEKWDELLKYTLKALSVIQDSLRNRMCYGNDFSSILVPFKRFMVCPKCKSAYPLKVVHNASVFNFSFENYKFIATCPVCKTGSGYRGPWRVDDKPDDEEKKISVKQWSPHEIEMLHDSYTDQVSYLWRIPEDYKQQVRKGNLFHLERVALPVLEAIKHNQMFRFNDDVIYHMKEPTLAGIRNRGWGIPRILSNFRQIYYVQVLRRYNEAIAMDYVIPFRLITPAPRGGTSGGGGQAIDPLMMMNGGDFRAQVNTMIRRRRRDPASWSVLPFPVQYQMLGGDANQLAPKDLMDQGVEQLLNDAGTPVELYKGSLQMQTAPVALRLFESTWHHLVQDANDMLRWMVRQLSQIFSWESPEAHLKRVTIADDINKQMAILQLMMGQQVSGTTGLAAMGIDWKTEKQRQADEAREEAELQARVQEEMEQQGFADQIAKGMVGPGAAMAGAAPPGQDPAAAAGGGAAPAGGGAPAGGDPAAAAGGMQGPISQYLASMGPNTPVTPNDLMAAADQLAQELLGLPEGLKDSELRKLKQQNEVLHSLVRSRLDSLRNNARMQGGAAVMQGSAPPA